MFVEMRTILGKSWVGCKAKGGVAYPEGGLRVLTDEEEEKEEGEEAEMASEAEQV